MRRRDDGDADQESNSGTGVTIYGLLNVLDGVSSQEGWVLIITANHIENLDEALIRPGRTDRKYILSLPIGKWLLKFFKVFKQTPKHKQFKKQLDDVEEYIKGA